MWPSPWAMAKASILAIIATGLIMVTIPKRYGQRTRE
jgi:hypothetical protein